MRELSGVSEAARELAMSRFRLIQPHLEKNRPLQLVAADGKLPFRTAQRWVSQYRKFGLIALVRKSRDDRGGRCRSQLMGGLPAVPFHVPRHGSRAKFRSYSRDFRS